MKNPFKRKERELPRGVSFAKHVIAVMFVYLGGIGIGFVIGHGFGLSYLALYIICLAIACMGFAMLTSHRIVLSTLRHDLVMMKMDRDHQERMKDLRSKSGHSLLDVSYWRDRYHMEKMMHGKTMDALLEVKTDIEKQRDAKTRHPAGKSITKPRPPIPIRRLNPPKSDEQKDT